MDSLVETIDDMGNPFEEQSEDLLCLATKEIADPSVAPQCKNVRAIGKSQYDAFVDERLGTKGKSLRDPISKNKLPLMKHRPQRTAPKDKMTLQSAKNNCQLFSKLYIGCQNRDANLKEFFAHENQ